MQSAKPEKRGLSLILGLGARLHASTCGWRRSWSRFVAPIQLAWERPVRCCDAGAEGVSPAKLSGKRTARGPGALERRPWRPRRRNTPQAALAANFSGKRTEGA